MIIILALKSALSEINIGSPAFSLLVLAEYIFSFSVLLISMCLYIWSGFHVENIQLPVFLFFVHSDSLFCVFTPFTFDVIIYIIGLIFIIFIIVFYSLLISYLLLSAFSHFNWAFYIIPISPQFINYTSLKKFVVVALEFAVCTYNQSSTLSNNTILLQR